MNRLPLTTLLTLLFTLTHSAAHAEAPLALSGYYKNFSVVIDPVHSLAAAAGESGSLTGSVSNRLRIGADITLHRNATMQLNYDFIPRIQDRALFDDFSPLLAPNPRTYRIDDPDHRLYPGSAADLRSFAIYHNIDRAVLTLETAVADISLGRQAIAWGSARVINPTDVLAPFTFNELDTEDRTGVDALRIRIPTGMMGEIDLGYVAGHHARWEMGAIYARGKFYAAKTDLALLLVDFRENLLVGADVARSIGGAGAWLECALLFPDRFRDGGREHTRNTLTATAGIDYNLTGELYGFAEYHFNQAGSSDSGEYLTNLSHPAYSEGAAYLLAAHYLAPGLILQANPLATLSTQALWNLNDGSLFLASRLEYSIAEDIFVEAGCFLGLGSDPAAGSEFASTGGISPRSEFGLYPDLYFTSFRIYF